MSRCELEPSTSIQTGVFLTRCNQDKIASWPNKQDFGFTSTESDCVQQGRSPWHGATLIQQIMRSADFPALPSDFEIAAPWKDIPSGHEQHTSVPAEACSYELPCGENQRNKE